MLSEDVRELEHENEVLKEMLEVTKGHLKICVRLMDLICEENQKERSGK